MVKHIVCWQLKDEAHGNNKATNASLIKEKLEALKDKIEGIINLEVGINLPEFPANYDVTLYSEFETVEALNNYQNHPLHQAILPFVKEAVTSRVAVDYKI